MTHNSGDEEAEFSFWRNVVRRRKGLVIAVVAAFVVAVFGVFLVRSPPYTATAEILVDPAATLPEVAFMESRRVQLAAEERLGFRPEVSVTGVQGAPVVTLQATAETAATAAAAATTYAEVYVEIRADETNREREQQAARVQQAIVEVDRRLAEPDLSGDVAQGLMEQRVALSTALVSSAVPDLLPPAVLTPASAERATTPDWTVYALVAAVVGVVVGIAVAGVAEQMDNRVGRPGAASAALGAPLLGTTPDRSRRALDRLRRTPSTSAGMIAAAGTEAADAYTMMRNRLQTLGGEKPHGAVQVFAVSQRDSRSGTVVGLNLAESFARSGLQTVLLLANYRDDGQILVDLLVDEDKPGLGDVLSGEVDLQDALQPAPSTENLRVLPLGRTPDSIVDTLNGAEFGELVDKVGLLADVVIVLSPTLTDHPDTLLVAQVVDATIAVVSRNSRQGDLEEAAAELRAAGAGVQGVVFAGPPRT